MSGTWTEAEARKAFQAIATKASTDPDFRKLALAKPAPVIKEVTGLDLPPGFKVRFVENEGANVTMVLPDPVAASGELADKDLEQVAGGRCGASCGVSCLMTSVV